MDEIKVTGSDNQALFSTKAPEGPTAHQTFTASYLLFDVEDVVAAAGDHEVLVEGGLSRPVPARVLASFGSFKFPFCRLPQPSPLPWGGRCPVGFAGNELLRVDIGGCQSLLTRVGMGVR